MNTTQKTLVAIGAVVALAAAGFGYLIWDAWSEKATSEEDLETAVATAERLMRSPVRLDQSAIRALESNKVVFVQWRTNALARAARGDRGRYVDAKTGNEKFHQGFEPMSPPQFQAFVHAQAARYAALPGGADGHLVKPGFGFGFKPYVTDGQTPAETDLPRLQREWYDMSLAVLLLAKSGVSEITEIAVKSPAAEAAAEQEKAQKAQAQKKGKAKAKAKGKKAAKGAAAEEERPPAVTRLAIDLLTKPSGLAAALGVFASSPRFVTVDSFRFVRETDALAQAVGGEKKSDAAAQPSRRIRRGRRGAAAAVEEKKPEEETHKGVAYDPANAPLLKVHLELSVRDFNTRAPKAAEAEEVSK